LRNRGLFDRCSGEHLMTDLSTFRPNPWLPVGGDPKKESLVASIHRRLWFDCGVHLLQTQNVATRGDAGDFKSCRQYVSYVCTFISGSNGAAGIDMEALDYFRDWHRGGIGGASVIDCWYFSGNFRAWYSLSLKLRPSVLSSPRPTNDERSQLSQQGQPSLDKR
jgi:hypothetical protein